MPDKIKKAEENPDELQIDQPSAHDPDPREAITHKEETPVGNPDTHYRPGDPPAGQSMFPPQVARNPGSVAAAEKAAEENKDGRDK